MSDGGNVAIRFSVENAETVRQALEGLGKDGEKALRQLNAASQQPGGGLNALSAVMDQLKGRVTGLAFSIGPAGAGLIALGPVGLAVAAALGGLASVLSFLSDKTNEFAENAKKTKEVADTTGLTVRQLRLLTEEGARVGLSFDQVSAGAERFASAFEQARRGTGPLFEELARLDDQLALDFASAQTTAQAYGVLERAFGRASDAAQKARLSQAAFGRGGIQTGQLVAATAAHGGLASLDAGTAGREVDGLTERLAKLQGEIDQARRKLADFWGETAAEASKRREKEILEDWIKILETIKAAGSAVGQFLSRPSQRNQRTDQMRAENAAAATAAAAQAAESRRWAGVVTPANAAAEAALMQRYVALLGDAIRPAEQLAQKELELKAALDAGAFGAKNSAEAQNLYTRARDAFSQAQARAAVAVRAGIGLASEDEVVTQRLADLRQQAAKGFIKDNDDMAAAEGRLKASVALEFLQKRNALLGAAITPSEQLTQRVLELAAADGQAGITLETRTRSLVAFLQAQNKSQVDARAQIGVASEEEIVQTGLIKLENLRADGAIKTAAEWAAAEQLMRREAKETADALKVRNSTTPQLTRLALESDNLTKSLDSGLSSALQGTTSTMLEMAKGTKTLSQGLSEMSQKFVEAIFNALWLKAVVGPIANSLSGGLGSLFGGGGNSWAATVTPSAFGNVFDGGRLTAFANGGVVGRPTLFPMSSGMGLMGEAGPEAVMPLRRLSSGRLGVSAAEMPQPNVTLQIINNHSGAQVSTREEDDGRGGRKLVAVIEEMVAQGFSRPGTPALKALNARGRLTRR